MRRVIAIAGYLTAAAGVAGCAVPVTVTAASYALSGFTLIDSGKTVSDIVLSAAMDQDCVMWRLVQNQPICVDAVADTVVAEASLEADPTITVDALMAELDGRAQKTTPSY